MTDPSPFLPYSNIQMRGTLEEHHANRLINQAIINGDCWDCHLAPVPKGYCYVTVGGRDGVKWRVHRLVYTVVHGINPENLLIMHSCDNRRCIKPEHLILGTSQDNTQDMMNKGRNKYVLPDKRLLTDDQVSEAKRMRNAGYSLSVIAEEFGVCTSTILNNLRRENV